jgi:putative membrane protein insertion efficiency factor
MTRRRDAPDMSASETAEIARSWAQRVLCGCITVYQTVRAGKPSPCRYEPTCSRYAQLAIERHGAWRGMGLAARRVARCHPWGGFGPDPVPERPEAA